MATVLPKTTYTKELSGPNDGVMGGPDAMRHGPAHGMPPPAHALETSEKNFFKTQMAQEEETVRSAQGEHAVMRMKVERSITSKLQRLGPLQSSMASFEVLLGLDEDISFDDTLNHSSFAERFQESSSSRTQRLGKF
ncbi:proteasome maturation protein-like [Sycon ciliatum]|uniref:proteasome maturation protein-like n=1 Tax=Sycon ciliatum TaxID=27933 RepID=UPI0020AA3D7D|eukprot:scpid93829/ scgid10529/ Proteasome maturation protein homolog